MTQQAELHLLPHYSELDTELALRGEEHGPLPDNGDVWGFASAGVKPEPC